MCVQGVKDTSESTYLEHWGGFLEEVVVALHCEGRHVQGMMCPECLWGAAGGSAFLKRKGGMGGGGICGQSYIAKAYVLS